METANITLSVLSRDTTGGPMASILQLIDPNPPLPVATVVFPIFAGTALILQIPALTWHIRTRNLAASFQIIWISLVLLFFVINPIIWPRDDYWNWWHGYGLCDIESRILVGASVGLPGSAMCIVRKLLVVLDPDANPVPTKAQRRRELFLDLFLCIGFPIIIMGLFYIVQAARYAIFTTVGCDWWIERTWASIVLVLMWPLILSVINAYLSGEFLFMPF
jgi:pheromone a factor receptor